MIQELSQFTDNWLHARVKEQLLHPLLDWNFPTFAKTVPGETPNYDEACFGRCAYSFAMNIVNWNKTDSLTYVLDDWLDKNKDRFKIEKLHRCHMNFYSRGQHTTWHTDHEYSDMFGLLYYIDDSTGGTEFQVDNKIISVNHRENSGVFFNANTFHRPIPSDKFRRVTVSYILQGKLL